MIIENDPTENAPPPETYLSDGLYASFDGLYIWLRAERYGQIHRVALDPETWNALQEYVIALDKLVAEERQDATLDQEPPSDSAAATPEPPETAVRPDADEPDRQHPVEETGLSDDDPPSPPLKD